MWVLWKGIHWILCSCGPYLSCLRQLELLHQSLLGENLFMKHRCLPPFLASNHTNNKKSSLVSGSMRGQPLNTTACTLGDTAFHSSHGFYFAREHRDLVADAVLRPGYMYPYAVLEITLLRNPTHCNLFCQISNTPTRIFFFQDPFAPLSGCLW